MNFFSPILFLFLLVGYSYAQKKESTPAKPSIQVQEFNPQSILIEGVVVSILSVDKTQKQYPLNKYPCKAVIKILSTGRAGRSYDGNLSSKVNQEVTLFFPMTTKATRTLYTKKQLKTKALFAGLSVGQKITAEVVDTQEAIGDSALPTVITYE